eukprot:3331247-Pyramimonas_sp.AAC.1
MAAQPEGCSHVRAPRCSRWRQNALAVGAEAGVLTDAPARCEASEARTCGPQPAERSVAISGTRTANRAHSLQAALLRSNSSCGLRSTSTSL